MSTRDVDGQSIRADLLDYLRDPVFTYFQTVDVADYGELGQIWVKTRPTAGCERDLIFDYRVPFMTFEDRCTHPHTGPPPVEYSEEVAAVSRAFAGFGSTHSVYVPTRNRPIPPNQPPHPTLPA